MSIGTGRIALTAVVLAVSVSGTAAAQPVADQAAKKKVKVSFFKARVASDGFLTPGQAEAITVSHMPPKASFRVGVEPPPVTLQCGQFYFCDIAQASPAPGSPPFRTDKKGVAVVSFVMPTTYNIATDPFDPSARTPVQWANGQRVHIDIQGVKRLPRKRMLGFGFGRAAVQTSP